MKGDFVLQNYLLQPLFQDIKNLQSAFCHNSFAHVCREKNSEIDKLFKEVLELQEGTFIESHPSPIKDTSLLVFTNPGFSFFTISEFVED
jgi:hypothetical protein